MRIVFMGTPEFARKSLERLYKDGREIAGVFTREDKPGNRGLKVLCNPVKELALSHGTPVYQPVTLKDGKAAEILKKLECDLIVVVAYGRILTKEILSIPPLSCINIHGSILPKYRGASPVQHAVLNGEKETGVTSMYISETVDSGDIIMVKKTLIGEDETSGELFDRLGLLGAQLLSETVDAISKNLVVRVPQNNDEATYAPLLSKSMSPIDWTMNACAIKCHVRGLIPWPVATMELAGFVLKVFSVEATGSLTGMSPGAVVSVGKPGIEIACADGTVIVKEVQAPGGRRMHTADYLRGNPGLKDKL